ncbi:Nicotinamidase-related amidase [Tsukamurella pulmonis]|uniref:Nicotinamidase-related amidase n=1 Tax=Tsukamurella pulmonis TaxID=47312 RepID=A0A1H1EF39_9ACTN|nr:isochorismatase family protein [Tsukamurella pulmonis]SDQ87405.1 Nicotinamidase-related amidase [Tsukamurella pulmonis]SUP20951.1 Isochorismatase family protein yecD [Tsukamurella pulmonis]
MTAGHHVSAAQSALLVIDVQGTFPTIAYDADGVLARLAAVLHRARAAGALIVFTRQRFGDRIPAVVAALHPEHSDVTITKDFPDAFAETDLPDVLTRARITTVVVAGFATEACVDSTVRGANARGYQVVLLADCHTTTCERGLELMRAADVIEHHNTAWRRPSDSAPISVVRSGDLGFTVGAEPV